MALNDIARARTTMSIAMRILRRQRLRWPAFLAALLLSAGAAAAAGPRLDWTLQRVDGTPVSIDALPGEWLLVYFGYTYCPDLCPTALQDMTAILGAVGPFAKRIQPVFVTIDPERDTPDLLAQYVGNFAVPILPLTGTPDQIAAAAREVDFHYVRYRDPSVGGDSFDHSSSFFLVGPDRSLAGDFATELDPAEIAAALRDRIAAFDQNAGRDPDGPTPDAP
jgi:protein SCO1/2